MPTIIVRPTGTTPVVGNPDWTDSSNAYDNNLDTYCYMTTNASNYGSRSLRLNVNFKDIVIPENNEITSIKAYITAKSTSNDIELSTNFNGAQIPSITTEKNTYTITYKYSVNNNDKEKLIITAYNPSETDATTYIYEAYVEIEYNEKTSLDNIYVGSSLIKNIYIGNNNISSIYIGDKKVY